MRMRSAGTGGGGLAVSLEQGGDDRIPCREVAGAIAALSVIFISGFLAGLHIIEDKESNMMQALGVSPLGRREYIAARGADGLCDRCALLPVAERQAGLRPQLRPL